MRLFFFWRRARDTPATQVASSATVAFATVPASNFATKNSSPNCFLNVAHPLGLRIPCKKITAPKRVPLFLGGEQGIRTLEQVIACYTISNRAPSASSDNSPYLQPVYYNQLFMKNQVYFKIYLIGVQATLHMKNIEFCYLIC